MKEVAEDARGKEDLYKQLVMLILVKLASNPSGLTLKKKKIAGRKPTLGLPAYLKTPCLFR